MLSDSERTSGCLPHNTAFCSHTYSGSQFDNFVLQDKVTESQHKLNRVTIQSWYDDLIFVPGKVINSVSYLHWKNLTFGKYLTKPLTT